MNKAPADWLLSVVPEGSRVLVGYSGGADSTCLLHLLHTAGIDVVAAHLHHGLRDEADADLAHCIEFCEKWDISFASGKANVSAVAQERKIGIEEAGRECRYEFFDQLRYRLQCQVIATGHTADDQIETILMNLARGCGMQGLSGIPRVRGRIFRPILEWSRKQTESYCREYGLEFVLDHTNDDDSQRRSYVRKHIAPKLIEINPNLHESISRTAKIVSEESEILDEIAEGILAKCEHHNPDGFQFLSVANELVIYRKLVQDLPIVLLRRGILSAAKSLGATVTFDQVNTAVELLQCAEKGSVTFDGGEVVLEIDQEHLAIRRILPEDDYEQPILIPGETLDRQSGWTIRVHDESTRSRRQLEHLGCEIDAQRLVGELKIRSRKPGDSILVDGIKTVKDLVSSKGLSKNSRKRLPVLTDDKGIVWVPGLALREDIRVTQQTKTRLDLTFGPIQSD